MTGHGKMDAILSTSPDMTSASETEDLASAAAGNGSGAAQGLLFPRREPLTLSSELKKDFRTLPTLKERLGHLWELKFHTDVIIQVGPEKAGVEAHRIILSSASHVFERLFYESTQKPLILAGKFLLQEPDFSVGAFKIFIKAMYTNEFPTDLQLKPALEIFYAAKKYQVVALEGLILSHILSGVSVDNVFEALKVSTNALELTEIVPVCWKLIEEETSRVLTAHLEHLDESTLMRILARDHLNLDEVELFQHLVKWGSIQCKRRGLKTTGKNKRQMIDHLLRHIRFTTMSLAEFTEVVVPSRVLEPKEILALQSHISPVNGESRLALPYNVNVRPRFRPKVPLFRRQTESSVSSSPAPPPRRESLQVYQHNPDVHSDTDFQSATSPKKSHKARPKVKSARKASNLGKSGGPTTRQHNNYPQ